MNIIVIVIDSLRYDHIGIHDTGSGVKTPRMDEFARMSDFWDEAYSASYPTYPQRTDIVTGRYGEPFNPWIPLRTDITCLPELFSDAGYASQLIFDTPVLVNGGARFDYPFNAWTQIRGASTDPPWIDNRGIEVLADWEYDPELDEYLDFGIEDVVGHEMVTYTRANRGRSRHSDWNVARLFTEGSRFIEENRGRENLFLWIDCFDPHEPWDAPAEYIKLYDDDPGWDGRMDPRLFAWKQLYMQKLAQNQPLPQYLPEKYMKRIFAAYSAKVSFVDFWFGRFIDTLDANGYLKNTSIVLTADHGTCLGEFGSLGKRVYTDIGEPECHVPLIVFTPEGERKRRAGFYQPWDIYPTVLRLAGLDVPDETQGRDLFTGKPRDVAIAGAAPYHGWNSVGDVPRFTLFTHDRYANIAPKPEKSVLHSYQDDDSTVTGSGDVEPLWNRGIEAIEEHGAHPGLVQWFRNHGAGPFREEWINLRPPKGWVAYWDKLYNRWE